MTSNGEVGSIIAFLRTTRENGIITKLGLEYEITLYLPVEAQWPPLLIAKLRSGHYQLLPITLNQAAGPAWLGWADTPTTTLTK